MFFILAGCFQSLQSETLYIIFHFEASKFNFLILKKKNISIFLNSPISKQRAEDKKETICISTSVTNGPS